MSAMPSPTATVIDDTSSRIRAIALELFAAQGFDGTALQQIADRLGVTKAALYYHFKSKDELLNAVVEPYFADMEAVLSSFEPGSKGKLVRRRQRLDDFVQCLLTHRRVVGFLSRDLAVLSRPVVARRSLALQERLSTAIAGSNQTLENQIRISFALTGTLGAIVNNSAATADELRGPVLESLNAILRTVGRSMTASARTVA
jgi:AcrR family transcriptional regulator